MTKTPKKKTVTYLRILYLVWMVFGIFSLMYVPSAVIVEDNAAETAEKIASNDFLFRAGVAGSLVTQLLFIATVLFLYKLFKTVNKGQSLLMVILALVSVPIAMLSALNNLAALLSLEDPERMRFFLDLNDQGIIIASIFWGLWLFPLGYLVYKSDYFPKFIGWAVIVGGVGYTLVSFIQLLAPDLEGLVSALDILTFGEVVFILWLIIMGAKLPKGEK